MQSDHRTFRYAPSSHISSAGEAKEIVDRYASGLLSSLEGIWPGRWYDNNGLTAAAICSQIKDGDFDQESNDDWWPRIVMLKAVTAFADSSDDVISVDDVITLITSWQK